MFQKLNEQFEHSVQNYLSSQQYLSHRLEYLCECSNIECRQTIPITVERYRHIHMRPDQFIVKPGHEQLDIEQVTGEFDSYVVVAKMAVPS